MRCGVHVVTKIHRYGGAARAYSRAITVFRFLILFFDFVPQSSPPVRGRWPSGPFWQPRPRALPGPRPRLSFLKDKNGAIHADSCISLKNIYKYRGNEAQPASPASQPASPASQPAEGTIFVQVRLNPARAGKNYHTHGHPRAGGLGKKSVSAADLARVRVY